MDGRLYSLSFSNLPFFTSVPVFFDTLSLGLAAYGSMSFQNTYMAMVS
jgi:hypothetical protein